MQGSANKDFPPRSRVLRASFDTSHANPRVWNSEVAKNGNAVTIPVLLVRARYQELDYARVQVRGESVRVPVRGRLLQLWFVVLKSDHEPFRAA